MSGKILSFIYFVTVCFLVQKTNGKPPAKIVGGVDAEISEFPAIVSIRYNGRHNCGGVFITRNHILTAAHCLVDENPTTKEITPYSPYRLSVASGSNNSNQPKNIHQVKRLDVHSNYKGSRMTHFDDIGIITLAKPMIPDLESQYPISLPNEDCKVGVEGTVAGWGTSYPREGKPSEILKKVPATVLSNYQCWHRTYNTVDKGQVCAFFSKGLGFCDGDSGGPLIANNTVIGIVSMSYGCGAGWPDVYTRVFAYLDWINEKIDV